MKTMFLCIATILSACASQPATQQAQSARSVATKPQPGPNVDGDKLLAMKRQGYTIKDENGEVVFCRREIKTGSRLQSEVVCMTEKQIDNLREETQRRLGDAMRQVAPPQGK
jgi:hypothetical protein